MELALGTPIQPAATASGSPIWNQAQTCPIRDFGECMRNVYFLHSDCYPDLIGDGTELAITGKLYNGVLVNTTIRIVNSDRPSSAAARLVTTEALATAGNVVRSEPKNKPYYRKFAKSRF